MKINITGRHIETGSALRMHVETRLTGAVEKYFNRPADVNVVFSRQGHGFEANCSLHLDSGLYLNATGNDTDIYTSFEHSVERIEKQLRRYKRRLKNHHEQNGRSAAPQVFAERVFEPEPASGQMPAEFAPVIIAENDRVLPQLSVSDAVMQLELGDMPFVLFKSRANGLNLFTGAPTAILAGSSWTRLVKANREILVEPGGFEPPTSCMPCKRSPN